MDTPVLLIIFNRPDTTQRVFEVLRQMKPKKLFIAADGPRPNREVEAEYCDATRKVVGQIDWPCAIEHKYETRNLGCKLAVSSAVNWFFEHVEQGIILEDDCLAEPSFFPFCAELLTRYRDEEQVMMISGDNFLPHQTIPESYYFSHYAHIWGWATWRRAWQHYDVEMSSYPSFKHSGKIWKSADQGRAASHWLGLFDRIHSGTIDTWDAQWQYAIFQQGGLSIVPQVNLVSNIGFGAQATHTTALNQYAALPTQVMDMPLIHPTTIRCNETADHHEMALMLPSFSEKLAAKIRIFFHDYL